MSILPTVWLRLLGSRVSQRFPFQISPSPFLARFASMGQAEKQFNEAKTKLNSLTKEPPNDVKLKLYGLFKQATTGPCNVSKPGILDPVGRAKYDSWHGLGKMSKEEAMQKYASLINSMAGSTGEQQTKETVPIDHSQPIVCSRNGKIYKIQLNRPQKKNALTNEMYEAIVLGLQEAANDPETTITLIEGSGDYYCSGNDLGNFMKIKSPDDIPAMAASANKLLLKFIGAFIDHPKILVATLNGPAVGIAVTTLGLCDLVYAVDTATLHAPFATLAQTPEGCSSYVFPRLMGTSKAAEILVLGKVLTAGEAKERNLVTECFPAANFKQEVSKRLERYSELPPQNLKLSKNLIREAERKLLHEVNKRECDLLEKQWQSQECMNAVMSFFSKKSKM